MFQSSDTLITVQKFDPERHLPQLARLGELNARWEHAAKYSNAVLLSIRQEPDDSLLGAALLTARAAGSYLKITAMLCKEPSAQEQIFRAVLQHAQQQELSCVKLEVWNSDSQLPQLAARWGFHELPGPRTTCQGHVVPRGFVHWLQPSRLLPTAHYTQTEHFTCAAVAALAAHGETSKITDMKDLRIAELTLWRAATNFMACEPIGVGLALRERWPLSDVKVWLDTDQPVMVDYYPEAERGWRSILQDDSKRRADRSGLEVSPELLQISQLCQSIEHGAQVLLLLSLQQMLGYDVPHWVLCHGLAGSAANPAVVIEDSWVDEASGENWIDATCLPIPLALLDSMSQLEAAGYRAAVRVQPH